MPESVSLLSALGALAVVGHVVVVAAALCVIPGGRKPSTAMAWLILVITLPAVGVVAFLLFGSTHVERRRHQAQLRANERIQQRASKVVADGSDTVTGALGTVVVLNRRLGALPAVTGNRVDLFSDYTASLAAMTAAVDEARSYVHVEFYIVAWDSVTAPFFDALVRATARGVRVRLLFDHLGSRGIPVYQETLRRLGATAIEWHPMMPMQPLRGKVRRPDLRNHRKIVVVDGSCGFGGSQNLIEPSYDKPKHQQAGREWVELMARLHGPVVAELDAVFLTDWYSETAQTPEEVGTSPPPPTQDEPGATVQVVPSGPGFTTENNLRMFTSLIYCAQRRISLTSPYFVPDESLLYAVTTAAQRGVAVELFVGAEGDQFMVHRAQRSYYEPLLSAGVRIFQYPAPWVLHAKHFTIDDDVAVLGSSNMDLRSFALNYEVSLMVVSPDVVRRLRAVEDAYRAVSHPLTVEEWAARGRPARYVDNVMRLASALL